jgi:hypothetical protein
MRLTTLTIMMLLILASTGSVYGLSITEIMFNPQGSDSGREWIELHINQANPQLLVQAIDL